MAVNFTGSLAISGSLTATSTITAQTLVVQTITSSVDFVTGSTRFGSLLSNTHVFTGSINLTGSISATGSIYTGGNMLTAMNSIYTASNNMIYLQNSVNGIQQANTNNVSSGSIVLTNTGGTGAYSIIAHGGSTAGYGLFLQSQDRTAAAYYPILLNPNGGTVGIGTTNISTEANLYLGPQGTNEGGQLVLQAGTSYASASHLDNYQNRFRVMSGNNVGSTAERFSVDMTNGNLMAYGSSYLGTNIILSNITAATSGQSVTGVSGEYGSSSWSVNLATLFSNYTFTSRALSVFLQILGISDGSNGSSILVHAYKSIGGTWVINTVNTATNGTTFLNSVTASSNTITINWNTTAFGCVNVTMINRQ